MARKKISNELKQILEKIPADKRVVGQRLADELVFMQGTLETLKEMINEKGPIEDFVNGKQNFTVESPALKGYNNMLRQYNSTFKQLCNLMPKEDTTRSSGNALYDFIEGKE